MKFSEKKANILRKVIPLLLVVAVPALVLGQKHSAPAAHAAPAAHSAPKAAPQSHASASHAAPQSHANTSRPSGGAGASHAGANGASHNSAAGASRTGASRPGGAAGTTHAGATGASRGATTASHGAAGTSHAGGAANTHAGAAGASRGAAGGARGGAAGNTRAGGASRTPPGRTMALKGGGSANIRPNGSVRSINRGGMQISHGVHGGSRVVGMHNGARVVNTGRHGGYVQRNYMSRGGHSYVSRTYYHGGRAYVGVYRSYGWHGYCCYYGYHPGFFYGAGFYGWAYNPWAAPVYWGWGWGGAPWYGYYGAFFQPYPVYPAPAFWLTDYLLAASLQAAYAANQEAAAAGDEGAAANGGGSDNLQASNGGGGAAPTAGGQVTLTPEVKQAIAEEVKAELAAEKDEAASAAAPAPAGGGQQASTDQVPPALDPAQRTFVVNDPISVVDADGNECGLTAGDVVTRITDTPDADKNVNASVSASKKDDCAAGKTVAVAVDDLQEMHNHFREQLDKGMGELAKKSGTGGLPKAPDTSTTAGDVPPPQADPNAEKTLADQQAAADKTEADVKQEAASGSGGGGK